MYQYLWLIPWGFVIGAYGTLIGAGGGFILVPLLILFFPQESPVIITSISLAVVFFNALSGSVAYARMGRVDYRSGLIFSAATIPGAVLGALSTALLPRRILDAVLGIVMIGASLYLALHREGEIEETGRGAVCGLRREITEADGTRHAYSFNPLLGAALSMAVGFFSSLLGIGGGIIHVPALVNLLNFPVHIATATSHFILAIMALTGTVVHIVTGNFYRGSRRTIALSIGVVLGAQLGAWLAGRIHGRWILLGLALALCLLGIRLLFLAAGVLP